MVCICEQLFMEERYTWLPGLKRERAREKGKLLQQVIMAARGEIHVPT